ncbi:unnamed protein product [Paramecium octaurelia]|nr:unnamed protein product [Paramecium octaurelia]
MTDFALTTFSSKGKLLQIEYALNAVAKGDTAIGIKAKNGVVLVVEKKQSSILVEESSVQKVALLTDNIAATYAGLGPDFRVLSQQARKLVKKYDLKYQEEIFVQTLSRELAEDVQVATQRGGIRPFGVSILIAGYDEEGPHLVQLDPSGAYYSWKATAIGKQAKNAKAFLEKRYNADMEIEDAINTALLTLKEGFEGQMTATNIEVGVIRDDHVFRILPPSQVKDYLEELE